MKKTLTIPVLALGILGTGDTAFGAPINLIENGGFESPDIPGSYDTFYYAPAGFVWTITNGYINPINDFWSGVSGTTNPDGFDQSIDIDYATVVSQTFVTEPGMRYELSFWYANNPALNSVSSAGYVRVTGDSLLLSDRLVHTGSLIYDMRFTNYTRRFVADGTTATLAFQGEFSNGLIGFVIDDVSVVAVPEPSTVALASLGAGALWYIRRRRT